MTKLEDDYDLKKLEEIKVRDLRYFIMPRYKHHYISNDYEDFSLDIMLQNLREDSVFIDIGSHYGIYSLTASKKAKNGKVVAIEPVKENYRILQKNIETNNIKNIEALNYAASDENGEAEFNIPWASDSAGFYKHPNAETIKRVTVKMARPDDLIKNQKVDFIKIDTEGHEIHVLDGLKKTLGNNPKVKLLIELNPQCLVNAGCTPIELIKKLEDLNKAILIVDEERRELINITQEPNRWKEVVAESGYANLLCIPEEDFSYSLFISPSAKPGGAELALGDLVQDLQKENIICHFVVPEEGKLTEILRGAAIGYTIIPFGGWAHPKELSPSEREQNDAWNMKAVQEISDLAQRLDPHVIFSNTIIVPWGGIVASAIHKPHVWMIHEYGNLDHKLIFEYDYNKILQVIDQLSVKVIANSINIEKHLSEVINPDKIIQIYYRFNLDDVKSSSNKKNKKIFSSKAEIKIILVGRITESKGQMDAVMAVAELNKKGIKAELILLGEIESHEYKRKINDIITKNNLTSEIQIIGHVDNPLAYVIQADVALMCSDSEAFGRVTVEAMLVGKPVVGTNSGATRYLIKPGVNGRLYTYGNWEELSGALEDLYKNKNKTKEMGIKSKSYAEKEFTSDKYVKRIASLIKEYRKLADTSRESEFLYDKFVNQSRVLSNRIKELDQANHSLDQLAKNLERESDEIRKAIEDIRSSKSWRAARVLSKSKHKVIKIIKR